MRLTNGNDSRFKASGLLIYVLAFHSHRSIQQWRDYAGPEDIDYFECQLELQQDLLKSYNNVERIIAEYNKPDSEHPDYYCKWESLPYAEATWEDGALIIKKWPEKIKEFREREESKRTPSKHCKVLKSRPKFHQLKGQPDYMGKGRDLTLRDYQMDGLNWMIDLHFPQQHISLLHFL